MATLTGSTSASLPATGFIRQAQLLRYVPISPATLWRWCKNGKMNFPAPIKLSERVTAWRCEDVRSWLEAQGVGERQPAKQRTSKSAGA